MGEGQMEVRYEYLTEQQIGKESRYECEPCTGCVTATSLRHAMKITNDLKEKHRNDLLFVDVVIRLVG